jgi:hypothetical protein
MSWKFEPRSGIAGATLCLILVVLLGAGPEASAPQNAREIGRYRISVSSTSMTTDAFVIDTTTGEVWQKGHHVRDGASFFKPKLSHVSDQK